MCAPLDVFRFHRFNFADKLQCITHYTSGLRSLCILLTKCVCVHQTVNKKKVKRIAHSTKSISTICIDQNRQFVTFVFHGPSLLSHSNWLCRDTLPIKWTKKELSYMSWHRHTMCAQIFAIHEWTILYMCLHWLHFPARRNGTRLIWILKFAILLLFVQFFAAIEIGLSILFNIFLVDIFSSQPNRAGNPPFNRKRTKEWKRIFWLKRTHTHAFWPFINGRWVSYIRRRSRIAKWNISLMLVLCVWLNERTKV